jgi:hypothetical protein
MNARSFLGAVAALSCALVLLGCPPATKGEVREKAEAGACQHVGDSCEYSPGKLGTCVAKDDCPSGSCLSCQSQH